MIAGLDLGTTGCKIVVYDDNGNFVDKFYKSYKTIRNGTSSELDGIELISAVKLVVSQACQKYKIDSIGVDSFGEAFVMLDENDKPLSNIIISTDQRGAKQVDELIKKVGKERIEEITGLAPHQMLSLPKIMWVRDNQPDIFVKCKRILLMEDYVVYTLTGNAFIDYSLATRTLAFDLNKLEFSKEILDAANIDVNLFAKPVELCHNCGKITEFLQKELGFAGDIVVSLAGHDQVAVAIGSSVFEKGVAADGAGTVECITPVFDNSVSRKSLLTYSYALVPYLNDTFVTYAFSYTSGSLIDWFMETFAKNIGEKPFAILEKEFSAEPSGLLIVPHFAGAATPYMDDDARGAIIGMSLTTTLSNIYQAVLEGIGYEMKVNYDKLIECGINVKKLIATGGGASSRKWLQIKSDILNLPIEILDDNQSGSRGSAICGAVANGRFKNIEEATKIMVKKIDVVLPNKENHKKYLNMYQKYTKLYKCLKEVR